jgi:DNA-3-methyladenine glycosylase
MAVLLRSGEVRAGEEEARARRGPAGRSAPRAALARGPARLAQCLGLDGARNGADLLDPASEVRLYPPGPAGAAGSPAVRRGPRVGISAAADAPWRFWLAGEPSVSPYRRSARASAAASRG